MPRDGRKKSERGIYHIIQRGANRQEIFHDDEDRQRFLDTLLEYKKISKAKIYAWCLMNNHFHLLIEKGIEELHITIKRIAVSYVWYYNWKYRGSGHLFQDRFKSENVETDGYLMNVMRYIHRNPYKAGIITNLSDWKWSSYKNYYNHNNYPTGLLDHKLIMELFSIDNKLAKKAYIEFNELNDGLECLEDIEKYRLNDDEAKTEISKIIPFMEIPLIKSFDKKKRDETILKLKKINGISQLQLSRILGVAPNIIYRTLSIG